MRQGSRILGLLILCTTFAVGCAPRTFPVDESMRGQIERVEQVLQLEYPYEIEHWVSYRDLGTIGVRISDRRGKKFAFSIPGGSWQPRTGFLRLRDTSYVLARPIFAGVEHYLSPGARQLEILGREELAVLDLLDLISLESFPRRTRDSLVAAIYSHHYEHTEPDPIEGLSPARRDALWAGQLARFRRETRFRKEYGWVAELLPHHSRDSISRSPPDSAGRANGSR
jgi:hypothetical protein